MAIIYVVKGINDDVDTCSCCGKTGLKRVVWLAPKDAEHNEELADPSPYGTVCAGHKLKVRNPTRATATRAIEQAYVEEMRRVIDAARDKVRADNKMRVYDHVYLPISIFKEGGTREEMVAKRNALWPVLQHVPDSQLPELYKLAQQVLAEKEEA